MELDAQNPNLFTEISKYFNNFTGKYLINVSSIYSENSSILTVKVLSLPIYRKVSYYNETV